MQYRIQFLDRQATVILELTADARNAAGAIELIKFEDWPVHAQAMKIIDPDGREVHFENEADRH